MDRATKIAAAAALLRERRDRLVACESQAAALPSEELSRLEAEVGRLTRFLMVQGGDEGNGLFPEE
jgi:hypothetical protein